MLVRTSIWVGLMVAVGFCAYTVFRGRPRPVPESEFQPRRCEACGHRFRGAAEPLVTVCPKCGQHAAVRVYQSMCSKCGRVYDAYYCRYSDPSLTKETLPQTLASNPDPDLEYRTPGGEWGTYEQLRKEMNCPGCGGRPLPVVPR